MLKAVAPRIALRYLLAKKSHRAVNVISVISVAGVAVATMAIMVVLSVFNGFTELSRSQLGRIDPDLLVVPDSGKVFSVTPELTELLSQIPGVSAVMPSLTERALIVCGERQLPVQIKGVVPEYYGRVAHLDRMIIDGVYNPEIPEQYGGDSIASGIISVGTAMSTGLRPGVYADATLYVPRRTGRINPANPAGAYRSMPMRTTAVFRVDQPDYDNDLIIIPLNNLRALLEYNDSQTGTLEIALTDGADSRQVKNQVYAIMGDGFSVLTREQQQDETFRMIAVEKWITFLMLVFILIIACFNIVSTLSLMVLEKREDMKTLRALGATHRNITSIFVWEGWLITAAGGITGTVAGIVLCLIQQHFGLIKLGADPSALTIDVYPVSVQLTDIGTVLLTVFIAGAVISQISRIFTRKL